MDELPCLLDARCIQAVFRLKTLAGARMLMARGHIGPRVKVGRRVYIRRADFEKALERKVEGRRSKAFGSLPPVAPAPPSRP